jgi:hypothetical protein
MPVCYIAGMTILEKFKTFAEALPAERRREVEEILASLMDSESPEFDLTGDDLAELDRRIADPEPVTLSHEEVWERHFKRED